MAADCSLVSVGSCCVIAVRLRIMRMIRVVWWSAVRWSAVRWWVILWWVVWWSVVRWNARPFLSIGQWTRCWGDRIMPKYDDQMTIRWGIMNELNVINCNEMNTVQRSRERWLKTMFPRDCLEIDCLWPRWVYGRRRVCVIVLRWAH